MSATRDSRRLIVIVTFEGAQLLDVAGPLESFSLANRLRAEGPTERPPREWPYRIVVASRRGGMIRTNSGLPLETQSLRAVDRMGPIDTLIIGGGSGVHAATTDHVLVAWIRRKAPKVRRVCSVCT